MKNPMDIFVEIAHTYSSSIYMYTNVTPTMRGKPHNKGHAVLGSSSIIIIIIVASTGGHIK